MTSTIRRSRPTSAALAVLAGMITLRANRVGADDLDRVRAHGWGLSRALEAVWVACLFHAIVRLSVIVPIAG